MSLMLIASALGLGTAAYIYGSSMTSYEDVIKSQQAVSSLPGYNPYVLSQFQTIKDVIYSPQIAENKIFNKPSHVADGVFGISEYHIKLSPCEPFTVVTHKTNLNR